MHPLGEGRARAGELREARIAAAVCCGALFGRIAFGLYFSIHRWKQPPAITRRTTQPAWNPVRPICSPRLTGQRPPIALRPTVDKKMAAATLKAVQTACLTGFLSPR